MNTVHHNFDNYCQHVPWYVTESVKALQSSLPNCDTFSGLYSDAVWQRV